MAGAIVAEVASRPSRPSDDAAGVAPGLPRGAWPPPPTAVNRRPMPGPPAAQLLPAGASDRIQFTSFLASGSLIATALGGMARPETLPFQWLS